jgi:formate-dependent nitrite reductase membrane component NrfD
MGAEVGPPLKEPGYAASEVTKLPNWHGLVAWDLLFNNLATGLFMVAAISELALPAGLGSLARAAYPLALVLLLTDLLLLVLDLGDPLRFHHMLRVFKPYSPMSFGTWSLTLFSMVLSLIVAIDLLGMIG